MSRNFSKVSVYWLVIDDNLDTPPIPGSYGTGLSQNARHLVQQNN